MFESNGFFEQHGLQLALACAAIAIVYGILAARWVIAQPAGHESMQPIPGAIPGGAGPSPLTLAYPALNGRLIRLPPPADAHGDGLRAACAADPDIWATLYPYSMLGEHFDVFWDGAKARAAKGLLLPYAVLRDGDCVGISCYFPDPPNRSVEIGGTYFRPDVRGGPVNPEAKRLMMAHAFDSGAIRVGFKVDALNARSRAAVQKLGARQDGILRAERITWTGRVRDTVVFSVLAEEWPAIRERLDARLATHAT